MILGCQLTWKGVCLYVRSSFCLSAPSWTNYTLLYFRHSIAFHPIRFPISDSMALATLLKRAFDENLLLLSQSSLSFFLGRRLPLKNDGAQLSLIGSSSASSCQYSGGNCLCLRRCCLGNDALNSSIIDESAFSPLLS